MPGVQSFPTWERELKFPMRQASSSCSPRRSPRGNVNWNPLLLIRPYWYLGRSPRGNVNWNKLYSAPQPRIWGSFPTWERELKWASIRPFTFYKESFPTWERELKLVINVIACALCLVVPHVGTWIEISICRTWWTIRKSRSPRGNVNWNNVGYDIYDIFDASFPTWERELK